MEKENANLLFELEVAKDNLSNDIQSLAYIQDALEGNEDKWLDIPFIKNSVETLLKSMIYNQENIEKVINKYYKETRKEGVK